MDNGGADDGGPIQQSKFSRVRDEVPRTRESLFAANPSRWDHWTHTLQRLAEADFSLPIVSTCFLSGHGPRRESRQLQDGFTARLPARVNGHGPWLPHRRDRAPPNSADKLHRRIVAPLLAAILEYLSLEPSTTRDHCALTMSANATQTKKTPSHMTGRLL